MGIILSDWGGAKIYTCRAESDVDSAVAREYGSEFLVFRQCCSDGSERDGLCSVQVEGVEISVPVSKIADAVCRGGGHKVDILTEFLFKCCLNGSFCLVGFYADQIYVGICEAV